VTVCLTWYSTWLSLTVVVTWHTMWSSVSVHPTTLAVHVNVVPRATIAPRKDRTSAPVCLASATTVLMPVTQSPEPASLVLHTCYVLVTVRNTNAQKYQWLKCNMDVLHIHCMAQSIPTPRAR